MPEKTLIANVREGVGDPGTLVVASPVVGRVDGVPSLGVYLNPFDPILTVDILNERYTLRLPRDTQGRVTETYVPRALTPVLSCSVYIQRAEEGIVRKDTEVFGTGIS